MKKLYYLFVLLLPIIANATDPKVAYQMVLDQKAIIVDVRETEEVQLGMIAKATWFPHSLLSKDTALVKELLTIAQGKKVFMYCRSGRKAQHCIDFLKTKGLNAENLGGYDDLRKILPTESLLDRVNGRHECSTH